ncbi:hypothetical protein JCM3765_002221 [Sporobolomyces pararoseus]
MSHTVEGIIGPFLIAGVLSCFLNGVVSSQAFRYYQNFPNDRKLYKHCVSALLVLGWAHTALSVWTVWDWCVAHYGETKHLAMSPWSFGAIQVLLGVTALICRCFYAYRVWIVSKRNLVLPVLIMILSFASLGCALGAGITVFVKKYFASFADFSWGISVATAADALITGSLVFYLVKSKSGGLHNTNSIINKLIELLVSTNGVTFFMGLLSALLFWTGAGNWHIAGNACLNASYASALIVSLNARMELERRLNSQSSHGESHGLTELTSTTRTATVGGSHGGEGGIKKMRKKDIRTALGFGREDVNLQQIDYNNHRRGGATRSLGEGIQVVTHSTVVTDAEPRDISSSYLSTPTSEKSLAYYSNEKEEEAERGRPIRSTHFADDLERH